MQANLADRANNKPLIRVNALTKYFSLKQTWWQQRRQWLQAVHKVTLTIHRGEVFGLVGESGCGKSTFGFLLLRLLQPTSGEIFLGENDIASWSQSALRPLRKRLQLIFQDPYASLNGRMSVGSILGEVLKIHNITLPEQRQQRVAELLETVGLPANVASKYPHEFSGGQRQRIGIARALAAEPEFIVADEPVSALDVSIQAQIVNLLKDLQQRLQLTYLFISHDLDLVEFVCDRVGIMYLGRLLEVLPAKELHNRAQHPYSKALIAAIPQLQAQQPAAKLLLEGDLPSAVAPPSGCVFHTRCPIAQPSCRQQVPKLRRLDSEHEVACDLV